MISRGFYISFQHNLVSTQLQRLAMYVLVCITMDSFDEEIVRQKIEVEGRTHERLSDFLRAENPSTRGLSTLSVRRYCCVNDIRKTPRLRHEEVEEAVRQAISEVFSICSLPIFFSSMKRCKSYSAWCPLKLLLGLGIIRTIIIINCMVRVWGGGCSSDIPITKIFPFSAYYAINS